MNYLILATTFLIAGCAAFRETPPTTGKFLDTDYKEIQADPGRVLEERMSRGGDDRYLCGFVDLERKIVWLSRDMNCDWEITRRHEKCHIDARELGYVDRCHATFKPQDRVDPWVRQLGR